DHPNIAKVLDAGLDDAGRPYFVMELIKGVPITAYCDAAKLSPRERLELFIPVCHAMQHAHQKGIIHRDLKPSNILVALYDGKPVPKVIDFGVAKATGPRLTEHTVYTEVGSLIDTLEYMSPEQAELNNLDVDTRSDIYTLGVVLYELLTDSVPFSRKELQEAAFTEERQEKDAALEAEGKRRKQARAALDAMSSQIIEDWLAKHTVLLPEHKRFLESTLRQYEAFAADTGKVEESRAGVARAFFR